MCGIAGVLTLSSQAETQRYIAIIQTALDHRGPDDRGVYLSDNREVTLIHSRLAILDLSQNGHQPMSIANQRYWITFNGEIYNFLELRERLQREGETFFSDTDTEVILKLYAKHGARCVDLLRGMFAFAIWDDREKVCFIARDPLGIKPLYYWQNGSTLIFASELRAIIATGLVPKQLSSLGLYRYFTNGSVPEPLTMIEGVKVLEAGTYLIWKSGQLQQQKYWEISFPIGQLDQPDRKIYDVPEAIALTRSALLDSVKHHLISDVPVGVFLSGGIDSTAIVAIAKQIQRQELRTFSIVFNEERWNEGALSQRVAQDFDTLHTEYLLTADIAQSLLSEYWRSLDQPTIDGFNTFCVSKLAHHHDMKVVLSGLGSDELFGGYSTWQTVPWINSQRQNISFLEPITNFIGNSLSILSKSPKYRRLGAFLMKENSIRNAYDLARGVFSDWEACQLVQLYLGNNLGDRLQDEIIHSLKTENHNYPQFSTAQDEVSYLEISRYMRNQLLRDSDVMSMKWGLELRVPFVDSHLFREISQIPASIRLQSSKKLLTTAIPEIPDYIVNQRKRGFTIPFERWLDHNWTNQTMNVQIPKHIPLPPQQWYRRWSLIILQNWLQAISL